MTKWMRAFKFGRRRVSTRSTSETIKQDLDAYRKWSQRKVSDRLSW
jgi:hypothetical protein